MDEEYLHPATVPENQGQKSQDLDTERAVVHVTGNARVDSTVAALGRLPGLPADEHVAVLEEVHGQLRDILGELDDSDPARPGQPKGRR